MFALGGWRSRHDDLGELPGVIATSVADAEEMIGRIGWTDIVWLKRDPMMLLPCKRGRGLEFGALSFT
jgi:hypothetical protein